MQVSARRIWRAVERLAAWSLLPLLLLQFVSGYAILHWRLFSGVIGRTTAFRLHGVLQPITVAAVAIHGLTRLRRGLGRLGIRGRVLDGVLVLIGLGLMAASIHLHLLG